MSEKNKKAFTVLDYIEHLLTLASDDSGPISISTFFLVLMFL